MLLLITGSLDGTSDLLVRKLGKNNVFRLNYDLYKDYKLEFTPEFWRVINPAGHEINSNTVTSAFWWKAFNFYLQDEDRFITEEVKYIFREIYHWCRLRGITKGNPHDYHNHMGKLNILSVASKFYKTPRTLTTFKLLGLDGLNDVEVVAKSFSSGLTTTNKTLMTTAVNTAALHPEFPWYLQEKINSTADVTIFICGDGFYAFERDRTNLVGLDWRTEQSMDAKVEEWITLELTEEEFESTKRFCEALNVNFGRIDLMRDGEELIFLEYNANGQWVFLDFSDKVGLVGRVADYIRQC